MSFAIFIFLTYKSFSYLIMNFSYQPKYIFCTAFFRFVGFNLVKFVFPEIFGQS